MQSFYSPLVAVSLFAFLAFTLKPFDRAAKPPQLPVVPREEAVSMRAQAIKSIVTTAYYDDEFFPRMSPEDAATWGLVLAGKTIFDSPSPAAAGRYVEKDPIIWRFNGPEGVVYTIVVAIREVGLTATGYTPAFAIYRETEEGGTTRFESFKGATEWQFRRHYDDSGKWTKIESDHMFEIQSEALEYLRRATR